MRTNIVLDDNLLKEAFKCADVSTKKDLVNLALKEFVENHMRLNMRELKGKVKFREDYDYKKSRRGV